MSGNQNPGGVVLINNDTFITTTFGHPQIPQIELDPIRWRIMILFGLTGFFYGINDDIDVWYQTAVSNH